MTTRESPVQTALKTGARTLISLHEDFSIKSKVHAEFPNLVLLKYDQIGSPMGDPIVQDCRGIILDMDDNWRIISYPYTKFFNYGEGHAAKIDWATATAHEKLDGSLMTLYWYKGSWRVSSSGVPDASGEIFGTSITFKELFWRTWMDLGYDLPPEEFKNTCFMFEMMTPLNRIITKIEKSRIVLHGARSLVQDLREFPPEFHSKMFGWECVKTYPLNTLEDVVAAAKALNPMENEGYVVVDNNYNRIKVKSPQYVALAHIKEGMSIRRLTEIVLVNENEEFLTYFPEYKEPFLVIKSEISKEIELLEKIYEEHKGIENQGEFARTILPLSAFSCVLFKVRKGEGTVKSEFSKLRAEVVMEKLKLQSKVKEIL